MAGRLLSPAEVGRSATARALSLAEIERRPFVLRVVDVVSTVEAVGTCAVDGPCVLYDRRMRPIVRFSRDDWLAGVWQSYTARIWARGAILCFSSGSESGTPVYFCADRFARAAVVQAASELLPDGDCTCAVLTDDGVVHTMRVKKSADEWDNLRSIALTFISSGSGALAASVVGLFSGGLSAVFGVFILMFLGMLLFCTHML